MIKLRITGTLNEVQAFRDSLKDDNYFILTCSDPYPNRGDSKYYRLYMDIDNLETESLNSTKKAMAAFEKAMDEVLETFFGDTIKAVQHD